MPDGSTKTATITNHDGLQWIDTPISKTAATTLHHDKPKITSKDTPLSSNTIHSEGKKHFSFYTNSNTKTSPWFDPPYSNVVIDSVILLELLYNRKNERVLFCLLILGCLVDSFIYKYNTLLHFNLRGFCLVVSIETIICFFYLKSIYKFFDVYLKKSLDQGSSKMFVSSLLIMVSNSLRVIYILYIMKNG